MHKIIVVLTVLAPMLGVSNADAASERADQLVRIALSLDKHPENGARMFAKNCASCHASESTATTDYRIPSLAGQRQSYIIKQLADFSLRQRDSVAMHAALSQAGLREPQAWADIAAYVNQQTPVSSPETGDGQDLELGEAIYGEECAACHGDDGRGDDDGFVPSLRNQHYRYLVRQMKNFADWHRRNVDADLVRFLASFEEQERMAVADYLSRLRGPVRDRTRLNEDGTAGD